MIEMTQRFFLFKYVLYADDRRTWAIIRHICSLTALLHLADQEEEEEKKWMGNKWLYILMCLQT